MGKVNTTKGLENSWIRWSSLLALLSTVLKEAMKRFSSRSCWIFFSVVFDKRAHTFLCSPQKRAEYPLSVIKALFVLFYLQLFILLLTQLASEYRLAEYTALFSSRSGCIQALENTEKKNKTKILQWWDRGDIYNNLCCKIHSTIRICVKLFDHSHSVNNNNNKMLLVDNNISS